MEMMTKTNIFKNEDSQEDDGDNGMKTKSQVVTPIRSKVKMDNNKMTYLAKSV